MIWGYPYFWKHPCVLSFVRLQCWRSFCYVSGKMCTFNCLSYLKHTSSQGASKTAEKLDSANNKFMILTVGIGVCKFALQNFQIDPTELEDGLNLFSQRHSRLYYSCRDYTILLLNWIVVCWFHPTDLKRLVLNTTIRMLVFALSRCMTHPAVSVIHTPTAEVGKGWGEKLHATYRWLRPNIPVNWGIAYLNVPHILTQRIVWYWRFFFHTLNVALTGNLQEIAMESTLCNVGKWLVTPPLNYWVKGINFFQ